jgi:hypothetical protein
MCVVKRIAIHQPQYLPYLGFFHKVAHCDCFVALDHVQFQKNGLQNRNKLKCNSETGWQWLTVPVLHNHGQSISQTRIDSATPWAKKHWNAVLMNYSRAPHFEDYSYAIRDLLCRDWTSLCELNMALIEWVLQVTDIPTPVIRSSSLGVEGERSELLINICRALDGDCYFSGPGGWRYMDLSMFESAGIEVEWQEFECPVYEQRYAHRGFIPNLSALDALLNCGRSVRDWCV